MLPPRADPRESENLSEAERAFGGNDPWTLEALYGLAEAYRMAGRDKKALFLFDEILEWIERSSDPRHPMAVHVRSEQMSIRGVSKFDEFQRLIDEADRFDLTTDHALLARHAFAMRCLCGGHAERAASEFGRLLSMTEGDYSPRHEYSLLAATGLALSLRNMGRLHDAIYVTSRAVARADAEPGCESESTKVLRDLLANLREEWKSRTLRRFLGRRRMQFVAPQIE